MNATRSVALASSRTVRLSERRVVANPRDDAFAYTAEFANIADWDPGVISSTRLTPGPIAVGSRFHVEARSVRGTLPMTYEIIDLEPNRRVVLHGGGDGLDAVDDIRLVPQASGIVIDYTADLSFHGPLRFLRPVLQLVLKRVGERAVDGLAAALRR